MKKIISIIVAVFVVIAFTGMFSNGEADEIYICAKKKNGQLRIVSGSGMCLSSEKTIVLNQSNNGQYEFVGFSTATGYGAVGILKLTQMCQATFPNSRMCTSEEIIKTVNVPSATGKGWVQPTIVGSGTYTSLGVAEMSGIESSPGNMTCDGWSNDGDNGLIVSTDGKFSTYSCSSNAGQYPPISVACCAP